MAASFAATRPKISNLGGHRDTVQADLGNYFTARTPTSGTGIIGGASVTAFTETTPIFVMYNAGPYNVFPMSLRTHLTVIGTNATPTIDYWTVTTDVGNRYTSGGTALTIQNLNSNTQRTSGGFVVVGGITALAATPKRRIVGHITTKADDEADGGIEVVHDTHTISWGDTFTSSDHSTRANTTTPCYTGFGLPPVVIAPNCSLVIVRWSSAQGATGPTMEYLFSWMER